VRLALDKQAVAPGQRRFVSKKVEYQVRKERIDGEGAGDLLISFDSQKPQAVEWSSLGLFVHVLSAHSSCNPSKP
jgi:hypothetical protein